MRSIQKRLKYALLAPAFIIATLVMQFSNVSLVSAATVTWDGGGADDNFSTDANWSGDTAPLANDDLVFPANAGATTTLVNDLGLSFNDVTVNGGAGSAGSYTIASLSLIDGAVVTVSGTDTQVNIGTLNAAGSLTIAGADMLDITTLTVGGALTVDSTFTGTTLSVTGDLTLNDDLSVTTLSLTGNFLSASTGALTVTGIFSVPANYTIDETFTAGTFTVAGDLIVNAVPTITTLNVTGDLTSEVALSITTLNLTGDYLSNSTGTLAVTGTFTVPSNYTVSEAFTAGTFDVGGNLVVDASFSATTTDVTGDLSNSSVFTPGDLTVGGDLAVNESYTANSVALTGNITTATSETLTVSNDMDIAGTVSGPGSLYVTGTLTVDNDLALTSSTPVTATTLHVTGDFTYTDSSYPYSTNVTNLTVDGAALLSGYLSSVYTIGGNLTIGGDTYSGSARLADGSDITGNVTVVNGSLTQVDGATISMSGLTVKNGQSATLNGTIDFPITFGSGSSKSLPSLAYNGYSSSEGAYTTLTFTGAITLENDLKVAVYGDKENGKVEFNGDITYNDFSIRKSNSSTGKLYIDGEEVKNPVITSEFNGEKWDTSETITENETATLNGTRSSIVVYPGGTLKGTGTAVSGYFEYDATLSPGNSPGTITFLTTLTLTADSILYAELQDTDTYDQVVVGADYTDSGNAVDITDATLTLALYTGYSMSEGDEFTIIDNQSDTDILGTFSGLAEGATISLGGGEFTISYVGGDGNDVVLTVVDVPTAVVGAPNTGILRLIKANPAVSAILGLTTAGILFLLARRRLAMQQR